MDVWSRRTFVPNADRMTRLKSGTASKAMIRVPPGGNPPGGEKPSVFSLDLDLSLNPSPAVPIFHKTAVPPVFFWYSLFCEKEKTPEKKDRW